MTEPGTFAPKLRGDALVGLDVDDQAMVSRVFTVVLRKRMNGVRRTE